MKKVLKAQDVEFCYTVEGTGSQAVILMHGWGCDHTTLASIEQLLTGSFTVYNVDFPGFGDSTEPPVEWGMEQYTAIIEQMVKAERISRPIMMGHSFGGRVGIVYASRNDVDKLVLIDAAGVKPRRSLKYYFKVYSYKAYRRLLPLLVGRNRADNIIDNYRRRVGSSDYNNASPMMRRIMNEFARKSPETLRHYGLRPEAREKSYDNFEVQACSRCGICIDPCQLQSQLGINDVQSVYFLRDRRYAMLQQKIANNCLMCGRCEEVCPVGINLNTLRLNSRTTMRNIPNERRYNYLAGVDRSQGDGRVGYFAGCMTLLTPKTLAAMQRIFDAAHEDVWWADKDGGVCCGRPLKLSGEVDSAQKMIDYNKDLFRRHGITTLVTSCPICLRVFREEYALEGVEVLHHSEYILRLMRQGRLSVKYSAATFTYHDPCELGRGSGIYDEPRAVIEAVGHLMEPAHTREDSLCCGSSVANTAINDAQQLTIAEGVAHELDETGAETVVTSCPLCKKAIMRGSKRRVADLSEIVAENLGR